MNKNVALAVALMALMGAALICVTACNKSKNAAGAQAGESAEQAKDGASKTEVAAQSATPSASPPRLNGSWLFSSRPGIDGYYTLNNGAYEYHNSRSSDLITSKGTYTVSGDIITFTETHRYGGPFSLHNDVLYTKDEVKTRYESPQKLTDELFEEYFPYTFGSSTAKFVQDANQDNDILISDVGIIYKRILASGKVAADVQRPAAPADFTIKGKVLEKYKGNEKFVIIPEGVTEINFQAFIENKNITNVVLPEGVTAINAGAFLSCTSLVSVNIPYGVTVIGSGAFQNCTSLAKVIIPESVTQIDEFAFRDCTGIKRLEIPVSVKWIGDYVFGNWTPSQTIFVRGKGDEKTADAAWGPAQNGEYWWRGLCNAKIVYM